MVWALWKSGRLLDSFDLDAAIADFDRLQEQEPVVQMLEPENGVEEALESAALGDSLNTYRSYHREMRWLTLIRIRRILIRRAAAIRLPDCNWHYQTKRKHYVARIHQHIQRLCELYLQRARLVHRCGGCAGCSNNRSPQL